mmetsp:Transcript_37869/g.57630  ORF Transcript_37869/g.57630 Transcript_37869/m.57630 type:complete len:179 (+) Transcript_37869:904-1440(+)
MLLCALPLHVFAVGSVAVAVVEREQLLECALVLRLTQTKADRMPSGKLVLIPRTMEALLIAWLVTRRTWQSSNSSVGSSPFWFRAFRFFVRFVCDLLQSHCCVTSVINTRWTHTQTHTHTQRRAGTSGWYKCVDITHSTRCEACGKCVCAIEKCPISMFNEYVRMCVCHAEPLYILMK